MGDKLKIGDFGYFEFTIRKLCRGKFYITDFKGHYEVVDQDSKNVELWDRDNHLIVTRKRITVFRRVDIPN